MLPDSSTDTLIDRVADEIKRYWGFERLRPIQAEAIKAGLDKRDSLVVMPTGGGKSLCYQVPPLVSGRLSVVVSPLISAHEGSGRRPQSHRLPRRGTALGSDSGPETRNRRGHPQ